MNLLLDVMQHITTDDWQEIANNYEYGLSEIIYVGCNEIRAAEEVQGHISLYGDGHRHFVAMSVDGGPYQPCYPRKLIKV